jgi:hypothetical protein
LTVEKETVWVAWDEEMEKETVWVAWDEEKVLASLERKR